MIIAGLLFSFMVALIKLLGTRLPSVEIVFFRSTFQLAVLTIVFWRIGFSSLKSNRPFLQGLRALIAVALINCNFYAFTKLPLAEVTAIGFSRNLFLVILAVLILKENMTKHRLLSTIVGFLGILLIVRPGSAVFQASSAVALVGACLGAIMMTLIRKLTATDSNLVMMIYPSMAIVAATSIPVVHLWVPPTMAELGFLVLMASFGTAGQWCMIQAFRNGEATVVSPAGYFRLVFATILGFYIFSEVPDLLTAIGALTIVGSNIYLILLEGKKRTEEVVPRVPGDVT